MLTFMSKSIFPFDLGLTRNFKSILGPYPWNIFWPTDMEGDGIHFPVSLHIRKSCSCVHVFLFH